MPYLLLSITADVSAQNSRAATAAPYLQCGQAWMEHGNIKRALANFDPAAASD